MKLPCYDMHTIISLWEKLRLRGDLSKVKQLLTDNSMSWGLAVLSSLSGKADLMPPSFAKALTSKTKLLMRGSSG